MFAFDQPQAYDYEGLVITSFDQLDDDLTNFVLVLKKPKAHFNHSKMEIFGVQTAAFVFEYEETSVELVAAIKNMVRRVKEPLLFGNLIKWNTSQCNAEKRTIRQFVREKGVWDVRATGQGREIRVGGTVRPDNAVFWNRLFPVKIPPSVAADAEPSVWVYSWLLFFVYNKSLADVKVSLEFVEFDDFDVAEQHRILEAPWIRDSTTSMYTMRVDPEPAEDDDDILVERTIRLIRRQDEWRETIDRQLGLFVGNHLIISRDMPQYDFIIPIKAPYAQAQIGAVKEYPSTGEYLKFYAEWSSIHRSFLVTVVDREHQIMGHKPSASGNIRVSVTPSKEHPALFEDIKNNLGLIDDPGYFLTLLRYYPHLVEKRAKVEVTAVRAVDNTSVRYRIVKRDGNDKFTNTFEDWLQTCHISLENVVGHAISDDTFISPDHPNIFFKAVGKTYAIGSCLQFNAANKMGHGNEFHITECSPLPGEKTIINTARVYTHEDAAYEKPIIYTTLVKDGVYGQLAVSKAFGTVDTRGKKITQNEFNAWITESVKKNGKRTACTVMEIFSLDTAVPVGFPSAAKNSQQRSNSSCSVNSKASNASSKRTFAGPMIEKAKEMEMLSTVQDTLPGLTIEQAKEMEELSKVQDTLPGLTIEEAKEMEELSKVQDPASNNA